MAMTPEEIQDAIDPQGASIRRLSKEVAVASRMAESLEKELGNERARHRSARETVNWLRGHGVVIAHPTRGTLYLKGEEFDEFFINNEGSIRHEVWDFEHADIRETSSEETQQSVQEEAARDERAGDTETESIEGCELTDSGNAAEDTTGTGET